MTTDTTLSQHNTVCDTAHSLFKTSSTVRMTAANYRRTNSKIPFCSSGCNRCMPLLGDIAEAISPVATDVTVLWFVCLSVCRLWRMYCG